jgi:hypothetical protein
MFQQAVDDLSGHAHQVTRRAISFPGRRQSYTFGYETYLDRL